MPKPRTSTGEKNLISKRLIKLREKHNMSQRLLAYQLQLNGYDMDKNVITRIETNKRYVTDVELKALSEIFHVSYDYLIDGKEDEILSDNKRAVFSGRKQSARTIAEHHSESI